MSKCLKIPKSEKGLHDFFVYMDVILLKTQRNNKNII
jgi:hypothetical protein